ncbi:helix-turn-helix domain-containing protein [Streptomyces sp. NPDC086783]|uniref:helix-turn-helix domain-containing protein n=1 Tax=Streptomyces sp. NPDC086783 TaxID=3365758 RepID=UPI0037F24F75
MAAALARRPLKNGGTAAPSAYLRLYPGGAQRAALTLAFGCARVVFNDARAPAKTPGPGAALSQL